MDIPIYDDYFTQIKSNFWAMGLPYGETHRNVRYYVFFIWINIMIVIEVSFIISKVTSVNLLEITELAPCTCIGILSALKVMALTLKRNKIFLLTENLASLYGAIENDPEKRELVGTIFVNVKKLTKYFFALNAVLISVYNFASPIIMLLNYLRNTQLDFLLPYAVLLPFEVNSWITWLVVYVHSIGSGFICVLYFTTNDVLYYILTTHICANFSILSNEIKNLKSNNVGRLRYIVKEHQYILKLSRDLDDIFSAPNLCSVLVGSLEICALGFNLTMGDLEQIPGCILFLVSVLLQILMMSVFGENIITESTKIGHAAYTSEWYEMDHTSKKTILTLMRRAAKPQTLTAYKFSVIGYGSFSKILSTSWSYFTILRTVYTPTDD